MSDCILVLNAGSSSIKFSLFDAACAAGPTLVLGGQIENLYTNPRFRARDAAGTALGERTWPHGTLLAHEGAIEYLVEFLLTSREHHRLVAVGHRVMHGGVDFNSPVLIDDAVLTRLEALVPLAPLVQPHNLGLIRIVAACRPGLPQVACFDTAYHRGQPELAQRFALPSAITERGVRRYGFHGLSYEYIASVLPGIEPRALAGRVVVAHLGNGASMCALDAGCSVASTTGFSAFEGLPTGTCCGTLDPGVVLYLMDELGMDARAIEMLLYRESGLLGVSGISSDMRELLASADPRARLAVDLFVYRIGRELGSLVAALGGLDVMVFTGGIGEHAAAIRARVCASAAWLGVALDVAANASGQTYISQPSSAVVALVVPTDEELMIARHTCALTQANAGQAA